MADPLELNINSILKPHNSFQPPSACSREFAKWTKNLHTAFKSNKIKAIPYLQRGIDIVYSNLEAMKYRHHKKLSDSYGYGAFDVTNDPVWMVLRSIKRGIRVLSLLPSPAAARRANSLPPPLPLEDQDPAVGNQLALLSCTTHNSPPGAVPTPTQEELHNIVRVIFNKANEAVMQNNQAGPLWAGPLWAGPLWARPL